ncbi:MAG: hypothetical protein OEY89_16820 [Gammaproteobacteria bacterium]|nr:hypothetical protein [Gammaproteobacteria bacterium]
MNDKESKFLLGQTNETFVITDLASSQDVRQALTRQAQKSIHIFDTALNDPLYREQEYIDILRQFISAEGRPVVKVLISNIDQAMRNAHQFFYLSQRVPSHFQIRLAPQSYTHSFFIADTTGYLDHRMGAGYEAEVNFNHPAHARSLINFFDDVWNRSSSPTDTRSLNL